MRAWPPLNRAVTGATRLACAPARRVPDFIVKHLPRVGHVSERLPNGRRLRLWSQGDDWIANEVYWRGVFGYEPDMSRLFFELAREARVVLDIGAFVGYYALLAAHANPSARILAFEPNPAVFERLVRNVRLNGAENVESLAIAVSDSAGSVDLYRPSTAIPSSSSLSVEMMSKEFGADLHPTRVTTAALDDVMSERGIARVDLMKLDTETTEPAILRGARRTLQRDRPTIVCEVLDGWGVESQLEAELRPLGYQYFLLTNDGPVRRGALRADARWRNQLFTVEPTFSSRYPPRAR